jgi:putative flippase GtrA
MLRESPGITFRRWLKFNLVGMIGIGVQLAALTALTRFAHLDYLIATALAVECAVLHNFLWHERFTWADRASVTARQFALRLLRFNGTTGTISIGGNVLVMRLLAGYVHLPVTIANLLAISACSLLNFAASHLFVFGAARMGRSHVDPSRARA